jgi:hypothetical protein
VILNTPGKSDGTLRVWLDGKLSFESQTIAFRADSATTVRGILAEIAYVRQPGVRDTASPVLVTPFEFRW